MLGAMRRVRSSGGGAAVESENVDVRRICRLPVGSGTRVPSLLHRGLTLAISCEAVPASEMVRRGHPAAPPRGNGAAGSFVSCIALLGGHAAPPVRRVRPEL